MNTNNMLNKLIIAFLFCGLLYYGTTTYILPKLNEQKATQSQKQYTKAELETHNSSANCWVAYKNDIYNISAQAQENQYLSIASGVICGKAFDDNVATKFYLDQLKQSGIDISQAAAFKIGVLQP